MFVSRILKFTSPTLLTSQRYIFRSMIGQSKISSFFKTSAPKRVLSSDSDKDEEKESKKSTKKAKVTVVPGPSGEQPTPSTSGEHLPSSPSDGATTPSPGGDTSFSPGGDTSPAKTQQGALPTTPLSPEQKDLIAEKQLSAKLKLTTKNTEGLVTDFGLTWFKALQAEFTKPYFLQLAKFVGAERQKGTVFPPPDQVFTFTRACEIKEVKVVIIGQDPYHGTGQAHGLSFSVQKGIRSPPSLENMYKELATDIPGFTHPRHGNLTGWAQQGVLMLNACLTVRAHQANSHQGKGWEKFTDAIITWFNTNRSGLVFVLWGAYAQKKGAHINKKKHLVLKGVHPSPLSAHRGYFGSKPFSQCNRYLQEQNKDPIDWTRLPEC